MSFRSISKVITIICSLLILVIKFYIRPNFHNIGSVQIFLDMAPNLLGSFCLLFASYWLFAKHTILFEKIKNVQMLSIGFFGLLVINELFQLIPFFGRTFDLWDIVSSAIGLLLANYFFKKSYKGYLEEIILKEKSNSK